MLEKFGYLMKKALQTTIGSIVLVAGLQTQANANRLYDLIGNPPPVNIVETFSPVEIGFSFSLPPGGTPAYSATFSKIGFWVNTAANPTNYSATISLYDITASSLPPPSQAQLLNRLIGSNIGTTCTLTGQFCFADIAPVTLDSGKTYLLTSQYSDQDNNGNTFYARDLAAPSQVAFLDNIIYGAPWFSPSVNLDPTAVHGAFGPNLGGVVLTGGPIPVPAPLPLLGASAALAYSRRIKARIKISAS
jgi:hypothetical protein